MHDPSMNFNLINYILFFQMNAKIFILRYMSQCHSCIVLRSFMYATAGRILSWNPNNPLSCPYFLTGHVVCCISFLKLSQCTHLF